MHQMTDRINGNVSTDPFEMKVASPLYKARDPYSSIQKPYKGSNHELSIRLIKLSDTNKELYACYSLVITSYCKMVTQYVAYLGLSSLLCGIHAAHH